jgi:hypothetical protein
LYASFFAYLAITDARKPDVRERRGRELTGNLLVVSQASGNTGRKIVSHLVLALPFSLSPSLSRPIVTPPPSLTLPLFLSSSYSLLSVLSLSLSLSLPLLRPLPLSLSFSLSLSLSLAMLCNPSPTRPRISQKNSLTPAIAKAVFPHMQARLRELMGHDLTFTFALVAEGTRHMHFVCSNSRC